MELSGHRSKSTNLPTMPIEHLLCLWDWVLPRIPSDVNYQIVPDQILKNGSVHYEKWYIFECAFLLDWVERQTSEVPASDLLTPFSIILRSDKSLAMPIPAAHSYKWSPSCGMRDLKKECHPLIYQIPLVSSHSSSSLGWATMSDSN